MTVFANQVKDKVPIEDEGKTYFVTIRMLSAKSLKKAEDARAIDMGVQMRNMGGELFETIRDTPSTAKKDADPREQHYNEYDRDTVLIQGIDSWDFPLPPIPDNIDQLKKPIAEFLFRKIIDLSDPYEEPKAAEEAEKKAEGAPSPA